MLNKGYLSHVSKLLDCRPIDVPDFAARFLLGTRRQISADHVGYHQIDNLMEGALARFSVDVTNVDSGQSSYLGRLYTKPGGFVLKIRRDIAESTYRFVRAHELAHVLAYEKTNAEPRRRFANSAIEEKSCNNIATHLLLPEDLLSKRLDTLDVSPENFTVEEIVALSKDCRVTPWLVVRRIIERNPVTAASTVAVLWQQESSEVLRVKDSMAPSGVYVPVNDRSFKHGRQNQAAWEAIHSSKTFSSKDEVGLGSMRGTLSSLTFAYLASRVSVVQILTLDDQHVAKSSKWREARYISARMQSALSKP